MTWILNMTSGSLSRRIVDRDKLYCSVPFEGRPLVSVIEIIMVNNIYSFVYLLL